MYLLSEFQIGPKTGIHEHPIAISYSPRKLKKFLQKKFDIEGMREVANEDDSVANEEYLIDGVIYEVVDDEGWLRGFKIESIEFIEKDQE